jgi:hypothetical protein
VSLFLFYFETLNNRTSKKKKWDAGFQILQEESKGDALPAVMRIAGDLMSVRRVVASWATFVGNAARPTGLKPGSAMIAASL